MNRLLHVFQLFYSVLLCVVSQAMREWEEIMIKIEQAAAEDNRSGACRNWFGEADAITRKVR